MYCEGAPPPQYLALYLSMQVVKITQYMTLNAGAESQISAYWASLSSNMRCPGRLDVHRSGIAVATTADVLGVRVAPPQVVHHAIVAQRLTDHSRNGAGQGGSMMC